MMMVGKILEDKIFRIEKEIDNEVFSYICYDKFNKKVLTYKIDWDSHQFSYTYSTFRSSGISMVYKSENLFDKSNDLGILDIEISESRE